MRWRCIVFLAVLLFAAVCPVYALTLKTVKITAAEFNAAYLDVLNVYPKCKLGYEKDLAKWTAIITQDLVLNTTNTNYFAGICIAGINYTGSAVGYSSLKVHVYINRVHFIYVNATGHTRTLSNIQYAPPFKIQYDNDTQSITVWSGNTLILANTTLYRPVMPRFILYKTNYPNLVASGEMLIRITTDAPAANMLDVVVQLLPAVLIIAFLGVAMALMKSTVRT